MTVHARGELKFVEEEKLLTMLAELTAHFENNDASPALMEKMPAEYVSRHVKAIVGFELQVVQVEHVFKLSQNRDETSYHNIIQKLSEQGGESAAIAAIMQQRASQLFNRD
jgi:transcriptional regulator